MANDFGMWAKMGPEEGLAAAILKSAVDDLRSGTPEMALSALAFFYGDWAADLLDFLEISPADWRPEEEISDHGSRIQKAFDQLRREDLNMSLIKIVQNLPDSELEEEAPIRLVEMGNLTILAVFRAKSNDAYFIKADRAFRIRSERKGDQITVTSFKDGREIAAPALGFA